MQKKIRVFEAFTGVGSQRMALRNLGIDYEVVATSDVDEFTVKSYATIHDKDKVVPEETSENMEAYLKNRNIPLDEKGVRKILKGKRLREFYEACIKSNNLGDISKVVTQDIPDHDLFTYSFPCQDISLAGKGLGLDEGSDTRSGLLWECQKIIASKKPKYLLLENVKNLVGKKHKHNFDKWLEWLEAQGYTNYWQVLNAKNYGVPQNRERVFVVSVLGEHEPYKFPDPVELELRLKDVLENEVDEKNYLDTDKANKLIAKIMVIEPNTLIDNDSRPNRLGGIFDKEGKTHQAGAIWDKNQVSPTLDTMQGGWRQPSVIIGEIIKDFDIPKEILNDNERQRRVYNTNGISPSVLARADSAKIHNCLRIRKLTPLECWRLMGFSDEDFHKAEAINSNSQLYKQAGNSIVVPVLEAIFKQLLEEE